jgi:hypothetical protein
MCVQSLSRESLSFDLCVVSLSGLALSLPSRDLSHRAELISAVLIVLVFLVLERSSSPLCLVSSS